MVRCGEAAEAVISVVSIIPHLRKLSLLYILTLTFMIIYQVLCTRPAALLILTQLSEVGVVKSNPVLEK